MYDLAIETSHGLDQRSFALTCTWSTLVASTTNDSRSYFDWSFLRPAGSSALLSIHQMLHDEGFTEEDSLASCRTLDFFSAMNSGSVQECEGPSMSFYATDLAADDLAELAYQLLASLPRARLATIQRRLAPLLQFDVVGVRYAARPNLLCAN